MRRTCAAYHDWMLPAMGHIVLQEASEVCIGGGASLERVNRLVLMAAAALVKLWINKSLYSRFFLKFLFWWRFRTRDARLASLGAGFYFGQGHNMANRC
mmetsp:Transcript_119233/g.299856  ORF Transcript_119233/g.299856 Transcript_119233/m.299856 type:complete len:99 (+) Transcript_119233:151-447(+)